MSNTLASYKVNTLFSAVEEFILDHKLGDLNKVYHCLHLPPELKKYTLPPNSCIFNTIGRESWYVASWNDGEVEFSLARVERK